MLPSGTQLGTTCKHAIVSCPNNQTTYPVSCSVVCPSTYAVKGVSSVACTTAGTWTSTSATYCRRINDPPTQVIDIYCSPCRKNEILHLKAFVLFFHPETLIKGGHVNKPFLDPVFHSCEKPRVTAEIRTLIRGGGWLFMYGCFLF